MTRVTRALPHVGQRLDSRDGSTRDLRRDEDIEHFATILPTECALRIDPESSVRRALDDVQAFLSYDPAGRPRTQRLLDGVGVHDGLQHVVDEEPVAKALMLGFQGELYTASQYQAL